MKMKKYYIIDSHSLEIKSVRFFSVIKNTRLLLSVIISGWVITLSIIGLIIYQSKKIDQLILENTNNVNEYNYKIDSLTNLININIETEKIMEMCYRLVHEPCHKLTHDTLWEFIKECDVWYPDIIMMQAVQESNCGKSQLAHRCNNLFGMKKASNRKWRCDKNRNNKKESYAEYEDWRYSVIDRILWERWIFRNKNKKPTIEEYMDVINSIYSETTDYGVHIYKHAAKYRD